MVHRDKILENILFEPIDYIPLKIPFHRKYGKRSNKLDEGEIIKDKCSARFEIIKLTDFGLSKKSL